MAVLDCWVIESGIIKLLSRSKPPPSGPTKWEQVHYWQNYISGVYISELECTPLILFCPQWACSHLAQNGVVCLTWC